MRYWVWLLFFLTACTGMPDQVTPVQNFKLDQYLGTWYEIARLDHSFERGLSHVSANYQRRADGGVTVINRGYNLSEQRWQQADGKAYFVESPDIGYLKVSFFGPFYGSYVVFEFDHQHYQYAFVAGPSTEYLWLLSRTPTVSPDVIQRFTTMARERGFDTSQLIFVDHKPLPSDTSTAITPNT
jgi:apolipoprotein D and lipocalin family protein